MINDKKIIKDKVRKLLRYLLSYSVALILVIYYIVMLYYVIYDLCTDKFLLSRVYNPNNPLGKGWNINLLIFVFAGFFIGTPYIIKFLTVDFNR